MAVSAAFLTFVLEQLEMVRDVSSRRMFGGVGLYGGDRFFAILDNDTLFFKVDDGTVAGYRQRNMLPFQPMKDKPPMTGYYQVPPEVLEARDELGVWASEALAAAARAATPGRTSSTNRRRAGASKAKR